jgi:glycosyltransferase involved in cell wall biosynthesis
MAAPVLEVLQPGDGGVPEHVLLLTLALRERGWPVAVAGGPDNRTRPALANAGIPFHELPLVRDPSAADVAAARSLRTLDRRGRYAIVHAHSSKAGALARAALPGARRRVVYTPHCFAFLADGYGPKLLYQTVEQALLFRSAAIIAVCEWERRQAERLRGSASRVRVIENGTAPVRRADPDPALLEFKGDAPLAGMIAGLRRQKEPLMAVRAAAILRRDGQLRGRLAIIGDGDLREDVEREIEVLGIGADVRVFRFGGDVAPYLAALDVFVLPSAWEALPLAVLEAMSCSLPVVATDVGGVPEAVRHGETGLLVPARNPAAFAAALADLLADEPRRRALGEAGRTLWERRFSARRMVDRTEALYDDVAAAGA